MDVFERIERSVDFIEDNLLEELTLERVAAAACFSPYHFHRIFKALAGESVGSYIRKRRIAQAAEELLSGARNILDIALDYRFQSHEAFSRSFKKACGLTPGGYRKKGMRLRILLKKRLDIGALRHLRGGVTMEPRIVRKESFKVVGMEITTTLKSNWANRDIAKLWTRFHARMDEIVNRTNPPVAYGICGNVAEEPSPPEKTEDTEYTDLVSVEASGFDDIPEGMTGRTIPERTYAVFTHKGPLFPNHLQQTYDYIYGTWVPQSGYELDGGFDFEFYDERFTTVDDDASELDIYVPIKVESGANQRENSIFLSR